MNLLPGDEEGIFLDKANVPSNLHPIVPLAQKWGTLNEILMYRILEKISKEILEELVEQVDSYLGKISDWLAHPDIKVEDINAEYLAFTKLVLE